MKKSLKWIGGIIAVGVVIFLLVKYGDRVPPEVWEAIGEGAETASEVISAMDTD
jgi:hypothetical protein